MRSFSLSCPTNSRICLEESDVVAAALADESLTDWLVAMLNSFVSCAIDLLVCGITDDFLTSLGLS